MKIIYTDGSIPECHNIVICGNTIYADDMYTIIDYEIEKITDE